MLMFFVGLFLGGALGVLAVCLCIAASDPEREKDFPSGRSGKRPGS